VSWKALGVEDAIGTFKATLVVEFVGLGSELVVPAEPADATAELPLPDEAPLPLGALGLVVISTSCDPAAMGPAGLAGQDPGGVTGST
jgi:hypothetical protein